MDNQVERTLPASLSEAEVEGIKTKHDCEVFEITAGDKKAWFKTPNLKIMSLAQSSNSSLAYYQALANNCIVAGDQEIISREKYFIILMPKLDRLVNYMEVDVKKL